MPLAQSSCAQKEFQIYITCSVDICYQGNEIQFKSSLNINPRLQLLPCTPAGGYRFHALAAYLHPIYQEAHLESIRTIVVELFCLINQRVKDISYFCRRASSWMFDRKFDRILNATLPNNLLQLKEGLRRSFPPLELHKKILDSHCLPLLLIYINNKNNSSTMQIRLTHVTNSQAVAQKI